MTKILLLEPDKILARVYRDAFESVGHEVSICSSAQAAILCADEIQPNLVIMELQLVSHSGIEFLYEFRSYADWLDVPVIVLTSVPVNEFSGSLQLMYDQLGIGAYLYKPQTSLKRILQNVDELTSIAVQA